ncbi:sugar-transfer associated ATP-grasp domain-containing protein [Streptomyces sp. NPDC001634]|uniref:sugar-transfer associated ATP-grasp domain-containing protein n=1 Tax=Streptomyces sp. NPDC001634 TaxID=3154390 RepID=UPI003332AD38
MPLRLAAEFVCGAHGEQLTEETAPRLTWDAAMAVATGTGSAGHALRSIVYGVRGGVDVWRHKQAIRRDHPLLDAVLMALRTSCDSRDFAALHKCGRRDLAALRGIVPRARRAEYRDWNNCAVAAGLINDKAECNRRLRAAGLEAPYQIHLGPETMMRSGNSARTVDFFHPAVPPGTRWMIKDRHGLQGESVWLGRACHRFEPGRDADANEKPDVEVDEKGAELEALARSGRLVAEELLRPEDWFVTVGDSALPTLRVVTSKLRGQTEVVGMVLFRGGPGAVAANRRQGGTAHLVHEDGSCANGLDAQGRSRGPCTYRLPASRTKEIHSMCIGAHDLFPCVGSVGWDVGLSSRGPFLLEGNPNWGMNVPQLMPGRPMLEEFRTTRFRDGW